MPGPANGTTGLVSARYTADGQLYVWDGANVLRGTDPGTGAFTNLSSPGSVGSGSPDTAGINFTSDGSTIVVGNGFGGDGKANNGLVFAIPMTGGTSHTPAATVLNEYDFIPLPRAAAISGGDRMMLVDAGLPGFESAVDITDLNTGTSRSVIAPIPGASTALAMDAANRLYVGIGWGDGTGDIRRFAWAAIESAFAGNTPLDWNSGELFNPQCSGNNSGAGMFFDKRGYLFVGGAQFTNYELGIYDQGIAVFAPDGSGRTYDLGPGWIGSLVYDPNLDQFFAQTWGDSTFNVYNAAAFVPEPASLLLPAMASLSLLRRRQRDQRRVA